MDRVQSIANDGCVSGCVNGCVNKCPCESASRLVGVSVGLSGCPYHTQANKPVLR